MRASYIILAVFLLVFTGCTSHFFSMNAMPSKITSANECVNKNISYEKECYALIAPHNSVAMLRLGVLYEQERKYKKALQYYNKAKKDKNFYANALLANLYTKGLGVKKDRQKAFELLRDTYDEDPMAAYILSNYYADKGDYNQAISLLKFAASKKLKEAQALLADIYEDGKITKHNHKKSLYWKQMHDTDDENFKTKVYGITPN